MSQSDQEPDKYTTKHEIYVHLFGYTVFSLAFDAYSYNKWTVVNARIGAHTLFFALTLFRLNIISVTSFVIGKSIICR